MEENSFKASVVMMILSGRTEKAISLLSDFYKIKAPMIRVGHVKGKKRALGVYVAKENTIYFARSENLTDPFVVLHEFYHHLRNRGGEHKGNEKLANKFAISYIKSFMSVS
ncbi:MAG: hypothetical protein QXG05_08725 [Nitrososphaerota archaeon]